MKYTLQTTKRFDKCVKKCIASGYDVSKLQHVMQMLEATGTLPTEYRPHKLTNFKGNCTWECHIESDWLLIWEQYDTELVMVMISTGTHSNLFGKKRR
ncbi:MAG: type II toxin-antitoxin system YafQ family toxin [Bacteroidales bacterium]|nr:type II toxin-antitoxin system YafQ family toxin [Bacteroidales bacterium]